MKNLISRLIAISFVISPLYAGDWTQFRGPGSSGIATDKDVPVQLDARKSVHWRIDLPGRGLSSPIIVGDRVFLSASSGADQTRLHVFCFDAKTGKTIWERQFWATGRTMTHSKTCVAAPTPASDGKRVFVLYSSNDLICLDLDGNLKWLRALTLDYPNASNSLGMSSSPVVAGDTLIVQVENDSESFAAGVDVRTGANRWKMNRPKSANWTSPVVSRIGKKQVALLQSSAGIHAVEPRTGAEVWYYGEGASTIPSSTVDANGVVYVPSHGITALRPGDDTREASQLWRSGQLAPGTSSPIAFGGKVYIINKAGALTCGDADNGDRLWQLRMKGPFSASPVAANGHIYSVNEKGLLQVADISKPEGEVVSKLDLKDTVLATPSIGGGAIYIRSDARLWKIGG